MEIAGVVDGWEKRGRQRKCIALEKVILDGGDR
jgi:hypothetical protein